MGWMGIGTGLVGIGRERKMEERMFNLQCVFDSRNLNSWGWPGGGWVGDVI